MSNSHNLVLDQQLKCIPFKLCGMCGKPFSIHHAYRMHPAKWQDYIASKIDFGFAQVSMIEHRRRYLTLLSR